MTKRIRQMLATLLLATIAGSGLVSGGTVGASSGRGAEGLPAIAAVAALQATPTVDAIVLDSYSCDTGTAFISVAVSNLPHDPEFDPFFPPLGVTTYGVYPGENIDMRARTYPVNPPVDQSPYTGDLDAVGNAGKDAPNREPGDRADRRPRHHGAGREPRRHGL